MKSKKGNFKMKIYYRMNKMFGYIIPETQLKEDALDQGYEDILDPRSAEYDNFNLHYKKLNDYEIVE